MSRGLIPLLTVIAAAALVWSATASGPETVESIHAQLDGQLLRSSKAFRAAATASEHRALALASESARSGGLLTAMDGLSRKGAGPDQPALDAATGAVAAGAAKRGDGERAVFLGLANEKGAAESRMGEPARFDAGKLPLADTALGGAGKGGWATVGDRLVRVAAVPVGVAERPAGALVLGYPVDDGFADWLEGETGADVTILQGGRVIASSLSPAERSQVASIAAGAGTEPFSFGPAPEGFSFLGISLPLGGPAVASVRAQAFPVPGADDARVIFSTEAGSALAPVVAAQQRGLGAALALLLVGVVFAFLGRGRAAGAKVRTLAEAAESLVAGDLSVRAPDDLPGDLGRVADAVNRLFARRTVEAELANRTQAAEAAAAKIKERQAAAVESTPGPAEAATREAPAAAATPRPEGGQPLSWEGFTGTPGPAPTPPPVPEAPATPAPTPWAEASPGPSIWDRPTQAFSPAEELAAARAGGESDFAGLLDSRGPAASAEPAFNPEATVVAAVPEALLRATSRAPARSVVASPVAPVDPDDAHFEQVFRDFVATRERCGEPTDGLTFDKFAVKLRKNREQLVEKYRCRSVRFTVYVKEGKAALKATPVKD